MITAGKTESHYSQEGGTIPPGPCRDDGMASITWDLSWLTWWLIHYLTQESGPSRMKLESLSMETGDCLLVPWSKTCIFSVCLIPSLGEVLPYSIWSKKLRKLNQIYCPLPQRRGYNLAGKSDDSAGPQAGDRVTPCSPAIMDLCYPCIVPVSRHPVKAKGLWIYIDSFSSGKNRSKMSFSPSPHQT